MAAKALSDEHIARRIQTIETLVSVFGFTKAVAEQAYDALPETDDISSYYTYILDQGLASDAGGPVIPIDDCPHVPQTAIDLHQLVCVGQNDENAATLSTTIFSSPCSAAFDDPDTKPSATVTSTKRLNDTRTCGLTTENWLCLSCGKLFCSRYQASHCLTHYQQEESHAVHVSTVDLSVWCHACQAYLSTHTGATGKVLSESIRLLEKWKHGS